ncbi:hypothetical protein [Microbispora hainanensis]|uniref:DUF320 domain-containing protein n=1 Tax=Microbispora hainanensis TaxID=568844 RepID=A0A544YW03_9ACTN|nr:hypothetical protein [Microbispora hainanensis]TQS20936.1 hypothetical protein FLX08_14235 [Microbispora hainanensis]
MTCRRGSRAFLTGRIAGLLLAGTSASTAFIAGVVPLGAAADNGHGRGDRAVRNVTSAQGKDPQDRPGDRLSVSGDTRNRGYQHTSANTAGGSSNVQNALCRRARVCNITQHVTVTGPTASPAPSARPTPVPTVTVTVTVTPTPSTAPSAAPRVVAAPAPCPASRPLISIDARAGVSGGGLLHGLVSLSVLAVGRACPGAIG